MAEDNMNELISNWSSMSMEDLGTSLLSRKSAIDKASRKKAKRDERIGMAMGVLMAGQSIFANAATKRLKEQEKAGVWSKARSITQLPELNQAGSIYAIMDDLEDHIGINTDGTPFKLNNNNILQVLDDNPDFEQRMTSVLHQPIYDYFIQHGGKTVADDHNVFEPIKAEILGPVAQNLLTSRDVFKTGAYDIFPELEGQDIKTLWERLSGMELNELDEIKIRQLDDRMQAMRSEGTNVFSLGQWKNLFHKIGLAKEPAKVIDSETGEETKLVNIWEHLKDQPLPVEQALKELNLSQNITESIQTIYATTSAKGFEAHAKRFVSDAKTGEIISGMLETEKLQNLQHSAQIETGIRGRRRGLRLLRKSPLRMLAQEINNPLNSDIKTKLELKTAELYLRLKDPGEIAFNRAFFDGTEVTDETKLLNAALSYTLGVTVKDMRTFSGGFLGGPFGTERPITRPRERGGEWRPFKDVRNFEYDFDTIERTVKKSFKIEDGQFKAEQYFYGLKPISQLEAVKDEFTFILSKTNLSDAQKQILTERLVVDTQAANSANLAYDFDPKMTNAKLIDSFNLGLSVEDILTKYETRFSQPEWYQVGQQRRIREADKRIGMAEGGQVQNYEQFVQNIQEAAQKKRLTFKEGGFLKRLFSKEDAVYLPIKEDKHRGPMQNLYRLLRSNAGKKLMNTRVRLAALDLLGNKNTLTNADYEDSEVNKLIELTSKKIKDNFKQGKRKGGQQLGYNEFGVFTTPMSKLSLDQQKYQKLRRQQILDTEGEEGYNARHQLVNSLGSAFIEKDNKGIYWIKDRYNWNPRTVDEGELKQQLQMLNDIGEYGKEVWKTKSFKNVAFQPMMRSVGGAWGSEKGEGALQKIRLGTAQDLGLSNREDKFFTKYYGQSTYKPETVPKDKPGFFAGLSSEAYEKDIKGGKFSKRFAGSDWGSLLGYKPQAQPSLLTKDDDKVLGRSFFGMPYIKTPPASK